MLAIKLELVDLLEALVIFHVSSVLRGINQLHSLVGEIGAIP
jgi:hypothetical protein